MRAATRQEKLLLVVVVAGDWRFFHLLLVVAIVVGAGTFSGHVLLGIQVDVEQGSLVAWLLPASLAATVKYLLHQLVHPGDLIVAWTVQCHDFPHGLGRHAGVTVNQGLCGLREGVGDTVAETLSQAGPVLDGLGLAAAVPHDLGDVLRLAPSALVREEGEFVYGGRRSQEQRWEEGTDHQP